MPDDSPPLLRLVQRQDEPHIVTDDAEAEERASGAFVEFAVFDPIESTEDPRTRKPRVEAHCYVCWDDKESLWIAVSPKAENLRGFGRTSASAALDLLRQMFEA